MPAWERDALAQRGLQVVLTGAQNESGLMANVAQSMRTESQNLCGRLSLGGLAALLARSRVVVSNDSGPLHLAHAVGTCTVGIYWCFNFATVAPVSRLRHVPLISWQINCPVCGCDRSQNRCSHRVSLVSSISIDEVLMAVQSLIGP